MNAPRALSPKIPSRSSLRRLLATGALGWAAAGCGAGASPTALRAPTLPSESAPPAASTASPLTAAPIDTASPRDPFTPKTPLRQETLPLLKGPRLQLATVTLGPPPKGVPAPPALCTPFFARKPTAPPACKDQASAQKALGEALALSSDARDGALRDLEACEGLPVGFARALRAEFAPPVCADGLVEPLLSSAPAGLDGDLHHALVGLAIASRLHRAVSSPPELRAPYTKERVNAHSKEKLLPWYQEQEAAVIALARQGQALSSYGRAVVALSSGWADLRMVEYIRELPIPDEYRTDPGLANAYYGSLDQALEPGKQRGRDGALVGLRELANLGVLGDSRVTVTRALLAKMYGGRRVDALDALAMPPSTPAETFTTPTEALAARLPAFYAGLLFDPAVAADPKVLSAMTRHGIALPMRAYLRESPPALAARTSYARARLESVRLYFRAVDVDEAIGVLTTSAPPAEGTEDRWLLAFALALRGGPEDVATLMVQPNPWSPEFGSTEALDRIAEDPTHTGALAAYDAAILRQIAMPRDAKPEEWEALAERFAAVAKRLTASPPLMREALARAEAARAFAAILRKS